MIKHIVMFKFKDFAQGRSKSENLELAKEKMLPLKDEIPEILEMDIFFGDSAAPDGNYDYVLVSRFESMDTLEKYQKHPAHVAFGEFITPLRDLRACIDYIEE